MDEKMHAVLQEISRTVDGIDQNGAEWFAQMMCAAPRIFFAGGGRSGLMIRALAMRAMHLGNCLLYTSRNAYHVPAVGAYVKRRRICA